jgi:hypothetical protein
MTAVAVKGRRLQTTALPEINTAQVISFLTDPTSVDVSDTLVRLWAESTPSDAENGYAQQARILAALLSRHINTFAMSDAMEACAAIYRIQAGNCLEAMYGSPNTDEERDRWLAYEQMNLTTSALALGGIR